MSFIVSDGKWDGRQVPYGFRNAITRIYIMLSWYLLTTAEKFKWILYINAAVQFYSSTNYCTISSSEYLMILNIIEIKTKVANFGKTQRYRNRRRPRVAWANITSKYYGNKHSKLAAEIMWNVCLNNIFSLYISAVNMFCLSQLIM